MADNTAPPGPLTPQPGAENTRLADTRWPGHMAIWNPIDATHGGFAFLASGLKRLLYIPLATVSLAGAMSAADKTLLTNATSSAFASTLALRNASGFLDDPAWAGLSFAANWSNHGESPCQYRKRVDGVVEVMGLAKKSIALVANDVIATLPAGFRPATNRRPSQVSQLGYTEIVVNTAGQIFIASGAGGAGASPTYVSLAGIHFDPAQ